MRVLFRQRVYGALLALIAIAILVLGFFFKPKEPKSDKAESSELISLQAEMDRLRQAAQRNSLRNTSARFNTLASEAAAHSVFVLNFNRPGWIVSDDGRFMTAAIAGEAPLQLQVRGDDHPLTAHLVEWGAGLPATIAQLDTRIPTVPTRILPQDEIVPGTWVVLVTATSSGATVFSPGNYSGRAEARCGLRQLPALTTNIPLDHASIGAGIFDLDGNFIAVVVQCDEGPTAISPVVLQSAAKSDTEVLTRVGMRVAQLSPGWQTVLKQSSGVVVTDVWRGWQAEQIGLRPGDVVLKLDGKSVESPTDLSNLSDEKSGEHKLEIKRSRQMLQLRFAPTGSTPVPAVDINDSGELELQYVVQGSSAAEGGLLAGDRILSVDGMRTTTESAIRVLSPLRVEKPTFVIARRGNRMFAALVMP